MEAVTRSPIYSNFSETINGAVTLRAFNVTNSFIQKCHELVDKNNMCFKPSFTSNRWLTVRLETTGNFMILFASLFSVLMRSQMDSGKVGLALSYALNITWAMHIMVRMISEMETNMVSAERIIEYQQTPQEAPYRLSGSCTPSNWPQEGIISFDHYKTRYRDGLDLVLRGITFKVESGEKIGIVGRTGAGKSSLTLSLFRIIEAAGGSITIDGKNIASMGLEELRSGLTIIPQEPFLFGSTIRINLDPLEKYSDSCLWKALEIANLKSFVSGLPNGLDFQVTEGGENFSVGQRQLICLARAVLRKTKILVLDEATGSVDLETDKMIQDAIGREFQDYTVLTIAHRLHTILDSSKVMVLDNGIVKEFDTPTNLLADTSTQFFGMVKDAGLLNQNNQLKR